MEIVDSVFDILKSGKAENINHFVGALNKRLRNRIIKVIGGEVMPSALQIGHSVKQAISFQRGENL